MSDYSIQLTEEQRQVLLDLVRAEIVAGSVNHNAKVLDELDNLLASYKLYLLFLVASLT